VNVEATNTNGAVTTPAGDKTSSEIRRLTYNEHRAGSDVCYSSARRPLRGEYYHADGAYGGLWRRNGRPPQKLCGVGFSAQGLFEGSYLLSFAWCGRPRLLGASESR
jgi:hypothetical protein